MSISAPKNMRSIGMIGNQFDKLMQMRRAQFEAQEKKHADDKAKMWAMLQAGLSFTQMTKKYRDAHLADKRLEKVNINNNLVPIYSKDRSKEESLKESVKNWKPGKFLGKAKDFVWEPDLVVSEELKQILNDPGMVKIEERRNLHNQLVKKGFSEDDAYNVLGGKELLVAPERPDMPIADDDSPGFLDKEIAIKELDFIGTDEGDLKPPKPLISMADDDEFVDKKIEVKDTDIETIKDFKYPDVGWAQREKAVEQLEKLGQRPKAGNIKEDEDYHDVVADYDEKMRKPQKTLRYADYLDSEDYPKDRERPFASEFEEKLITEPNEPLNDFMSKIDEKDLAKDAALMQVNAMKKQENALSNMPDEMFDAIKIEDLVKSVSKKAEGGKLKGPSHKKGGIPANVGDQPIEMEGGEYIIKKSSANKIGKKALDYINKTGKLPKKMQEGGKVEEDENNDPNFIQKGVEKGTSATGVGLDVYGAMGDLESIKEKGGAEAVGAGLGIASTALEATGVDSLSDLTGGMSSVLKGGSALKEGSMDEIDTASTAVGVTKGAGQAAKGLGKLVGSKVLEKGGEKVVSQVAGKAVPIVNIASGAKDITSTETTGMEKAGGAAAVATGVNALAAVAGVNAWNPVGWVAGALAVGGTLLSIAGAANRPRTSTYRGSTINTKKIGM